MAVCAQDGTKASPEKWRPKAGLCAAPGTDFRSQCGEFGDIIIGLGKNSTSGHEWSCEINRLTDIVPGSIRLDMTCNDYNLALFINDNDPNAYERKFKDVMLLQKMDGKSIIVRKTQNGKFKGPGWRADFCPEDAQRMHAEAWEMAARSLRGQARKPSF